MDKIILELTKEELIALDNLLGRMNYYEMAAIICKTREKTEEIEKDIDSINKIYSKCWRKKESR